MRGQSDFYANRASLLAKAMRDETTHERLSRLIQNAVKAGQFRSQTQVLEAAGLSSGYMGELKKRCESDPQAPMTTATAVSLAQALGVSLYDVTGEPQVLADSDDEDPERASAVRAAREMHLPEAAIQAVLRERPGSGDRRYWWLRIETVASQLDWPTPTRTHKL